MKEEKSEFQIYKIAATDFFTEEETQENPYSYPFVDWLARKGLISSADGYRAFWVCDEDGNQHCHIVNKNGEIEFIAMQKLNYKE